MQWERARPIAGSRGRQRPAYFFSLFLAEPSDLLEPSDFWEVSDFWELSDFRELSDFWESSAFGLSSFLEAESPFEEDAAEVFLA